MTTRAGDTGGEQECGAPVPSIVQTNMAQPSICNDALE